MFWSKSEPVKAWDEWRPLKKCNECGRLQKPFLGDFSNSNCPSCGSVEVEVVIARWEVSSVVSGFMSVRKLHRNEVKT